jgi:cold shock CspA family protein
MPEELPCCISFSFPAAATSHSSLGDVVEMSLKKAKETLRWFNTARGTGFVTLDQGSEYIIFKCGIDHDLSIGDSVEFEVCTDWQGCPRAIDIMAPALTSDSHPGACDAGGGGLSYDGDGDFHHSGGCGHNGDGARGCYISGEEVDALPMWSDGTALPVFDEMLPSTIVWDEQTGHNVSTGGGLCCQCIFVSNFNWTCKRTSPPS